MKRAIVNLVTTHNEGYIKGQERLVESLKGRFDGDVVTFRGESSVGAPLHQDNPYAFKLYAIREVRERGYDQILWLDASVYAVKDVSPVFDWLTVKGVFMEEAGHWAGDWSPEYVLDYFCIDKGIASEMPCFAAGYVGFDFTREKSRNFFARWYNAMRDGMFVGSWNNHRHDLTCGSIIACNMRLNTLYSPGGQFFAYVGEGYEKPKETAVFHLQGLA